MRSAIHPISQQSLLQFFRYAIFLNDLPKKFSKDEVLQQRANLRKLYRRSQGTKTGKRKQLESEKELSLRTHISSEIEMHGIVITSLTCEIFPPPAI